MSFNSDELGEKINYFSTDDFQITNHELWRKYSVWFASITKVNVNDLQQITNKRVYYYYGGAKHES